ncbi:MAG TPA: hypothetical protein VFF27_01195 [Bacteroidia bacterium]|jgi:hypothetical protein|nr:hypothetical protein [Bacteroidia bacterium]
MKKKYIILFASVLCIVLSVLSYVNSVSGITNINSIAICQKKDSLKISILESAFYIKNPKAKLSKNLDTLQIDLSRTSVYSIGYGKLKGDVVVYKNDSIKFIKICNNIFNVEDIEYCDY